MDSIQEFGYIVSYYDAVSAIESWTPATEGFKIGELVKKVGRAIITALKRIGGIIQAMLNKLRSTDFALTKSEHEYLMTISDCASNAASTAATAAKMYKKCAIPACSLTHPDDINEWQTDSLNDAEKVIDKIDEIAKIFNRAEMPRNEDLRQERTQGGTRQVEENLKHATQMVDKATVLFNIDRDAGYEDQVGKQAPHEPFSDDNREYVLTGTFKACSNKFMSVITIANKIVTEAYDKYNKLIDGLRRSPKNRYQPLEEHKDYATNTSVRKEYLKRELSKAE